MKTKLKNKIKQILFYLNRIFAKIYYINFLNRQIHVTECTLKILFVFNDLVECGKNSKKEQKIKEFKKLNSKIEVFFLSDLDKEWKGHLLSFLEYVRKNYDWFWLDTNQSLPLTQVIPYINEIEPGESQAITFDCYNACLKKPIFKPEFSFDMFLELDYLEGAVIFSNQVLNHVSLSSNFSILDLYLDLLLGIYLRRVTIARKKEIGFVSFNLPQISRSYQESIKTIYNAKEFPTKILSLGEVNGRSFIKYQIKKPFVSIIVPFRDKAELLKVAVESILEKSKYENYEILLVSNQSKEVETLDYLSDLRSEEKYIRILEYDYIFNFSAINNFAASKAKGDALFFLNNDTKIITSEFLEILTSYAMNDSIGGVGSKLLFEDHSIQHAGVILGLTGMAEHAFKEMENEEVVDSFGSVQWTRNYLALTAAALMVEKSKFMKVGGFNEKLVVCGNDVNLGIKLHEAGFRNIYLPQVELFHFESKSRKGTPIPLDDFKESIKSYYPYLENGDPFFHPKLSLTLPWISYNFSDVPSYQRNLLHMKTLMPEIFSN